MDDKLTLFRQQAAIIARKKESTAEKLNDVRVELATLDEEVKEKKAGKNAVTTLSSIIYSIIYYIEFSAWLYSSLFSSQHNSELTNRTVDIML